ncbi:MAG TPA: hypothetical protein PK530_07535 [Anaerolineales bacterium]|nr:hypothetical protein [Anaerolineales bacterium]
MSTPKTFSFSPFLRFSFSFLSFSLLFLLAACSTDMNDAAVTTVETYVQALADKNADQMIAASCAAWEESAQMELDAFVGVQTRVENMACQATGTEGVYTLITCTGEIVATYGAEDRNFPLDTSAFKVKEEDGEMRVCGR